MCVGDRAGSKFVIPSPLLVSDEGPGFPTDFVDPAFNRFTPMPAVPPEAPEATGLGLALVRAVAEARGGTVSVTGPQVALGLPARPPSS